MLVATEDHERRFHVARFDGVVELVAIFLEFGDVAGVKVAASAVDRIEVAIEDQARQMVIERRAPVMLARDDVADAARDVILLLGRREYCCQRDRGRRRHGGAEQRRKADAAHAHDDGADPAGSSGQGPICDHRTRSPVNCGPLQMTRLE